MSISAYPLQWPEHIARSKNREAGRFKTSLASALKNVTDSLNRFGSDSGRKVANVVISSNYSLGVSKPADPGVSVWFVWDEMQVCIPVDRYSAVEANLQAIHHIIEARRTELRHGTLALVRATFKGFLALPSPGGRDWAEVLGLNRANASINKETIEAAYRELATKRHPDKGGSHDAMAELNQAREKALREIKA